jgi:NADH:ubiquinone oxidoreductase subunit B-like Fe-S oxidoreductase
MEIETYDAFGNVANTDETYLNVDMFVPGCDTSNGTYDECESSTYLVEKN